MSRGCGNKQRKVDDERISEIRRSFHCTMNRTLYRDLHQLEFWNTKPEVLQHLGQYIKRVEVHPLRIRQQNCELQSLQLFLDDGTIQRVVAKETQLRPETFKDAVHYQRTKTAYEVELAFYKYLMTNGLAGLDAKVPAMYYSEAESDSFLLVMEDLRTSEASEIPRGCQRLELNGDETKLALDWLAAFHASFLGLKGVPDELWSKGSYWSLEKRRKEFNKMTLEWNRTCENFQEAFPEIFSSQRVLDLAFRLSDLAEVLDDFLQPRVDVKTLLHGDFKTANLFFGPNGVSACDFQWTGEGLGVKDLVYLLYSSVKPSTILHHEEEFLSHYYNQFILKSKIQSMREVYPWSEFLKDVDCAFLDYVRFLIGSMWGAVTPTSYRNLSDKINQGIHKRNPEHLVSMVKKADELIFTRFNN